MDMKLDDKALDNIALLIKKYVETQRNIINEYYNDIRYLEEDWNGDNFDFLLDKVELITKETEKVMNEIQDRFCPYFKDKAEMIRNRPTFSNSKIPNSNCLSASSNLSKKESENDKNFEKNNKEIFTKISNYLRRNNIVITKSNLEKISFYDPLGKSKNGLYKNIMSVDINSSSYKQDLIKLTGQHLFFKLKNDQKLGLMKTLNLELENKSNFNDIAYQDLCKKIKTGIGIEKKYLDFSSKDIETVFNFFTNAFTITTLNDTNEINEYHKYYSNTYSNFLEILKNLKEF